MKKETSELDKQISSRLRMKLYEKRIKNKDVAQLIGVSDFTVSQKLNGKSGFTLGEFAKIAAKYQFTATDVFTVIQHEIF